MPVPAVVVALGGNALIRPGQRGSYPEQVRNLERVVPHLARLARSQRLVLTHGNGPQVGDLLLQQEAAKRSVPALPLHAAVAMSQGLIGALLQEALDPALLRAGVRKRVVTVVTQVLVDRADPAFAKPSKPIGPFYRSRSGLPRSWRLVRTEHGWRRVVPSPEPRSILEAKTIQEASAHSVVVACGGGGVPVVRAPPDAGRSLRQRGAGQLRGVDAVIDKDLTAALLAKAVGARELIILTDVDAVFLDYGTKQQLALRAVTASQLRGYQKEGHFPPGSMGPKVEAALRFLRSNPRGRVRITSFAKLEQALAGRAGTRITA